MTSYPLKRGKATISKLKILSLQSGHTEGFVFTAWWNYFFKYSIPKLFCKIPAEGPPLPGFCKEPKYLCPKPYSQKLSSLADTGPPQDQIYVHSKVSLELQPHFSMTPGIPDSLPGLSKNQDTAAGIVPNQKIVDPELYYLEEMHCINPCPPFFHPQSASFYAGAFSDKSLYGD